MKPPEFYVGYAANAPSGIGRRVRSAALIAAAGGLAVSAWLALAQRPFAPSRFEFGVERTFSGVMTAAPYPMLFEGSRAWLLVAPGKHGLHPAADSPSMVRLRGSRIEHGAGRMIEVAPESIAVGEPANGPVFENLGPAALRGEIVDSKCYLGVMNPGAGKVHRDCAVRCISGGIPPALLVRDAAGGLRAIVLTGPNRRALGRDILAMVGEPVEAAGTLYRAGDVLLLEAGRISRTR